jgi:hypothetical protein
MRFFSTVQSCEQLIFKMVKHSIEVPAVNSSLFCCFHKELLCRLIVFQLDET